MEPHLNKEVAEKYGFRIYIPLFVLVILMMLTKIFKIIPDIGMPLMFLISAIVGLFTGRKGEPGGDDSGGASQPLFRLWVSWMGVGHVYPGYDTDRRTRIYRLRRVWDFRKAWRLLAAGVSIPLFGAVSSFGASSVLGSAVCTGIPEYGYRIYDCGAVLHFAALHDAADCSGRPLCG